MYSHRSCFWKIAQCRSRLYCVNWSHISSETVRLHGTVTQNRTYTILVILWTFNLPSCQYPGQYSEWSFNTPIETQIKWINCKGRTHADRHTDNTTQCLQTATIGTELLHMNKTCRSDSSVCFRQLPQIPYSREYKKTFYHIFSLQEGVLTLCVIRKHPPSLPLQFSYDELGTNSPFIFG
jgi:hypothetical protein